MRQPVTQGACPRQSSPHLRTHYSPGNDIGPMPAVCQFAVRLLVKVAAWLKADGPLRSSRMNARSCCGSQPRIKGQLLAGTGWSYQNKDRAAMVWILQELKLAENERIEILLELPMREEEEAETACKSRMRDLYARELGTHAV